MREILFRAKRIDNGEWVEGDLIQDRDLETAYISGWDYYTTEGGLEREPFECEIKLETICQFTGLKDKNGNRIWENDIVRIENSMDEGIGNIEFYDGMWYVDGKPNNSLYDIVEYDEADVEVIGNIFDNTEPMKGE